MAEEAALDRKHKLVIIRVVARDRVRVVRLLHLRDARGLFRKAVLPAGQRDRGIPLEPGPLRRRVLGAPLRRPGVRPARRPRRPQVHVPDHDRRDGPVDGPGRRSCPPTRRSASSAPIILVFLRLAQGLALGGEYGGAAIYVAEHAPHGKARGSTRAGSRPPRRSASSCRSWSSAACGSVMSPEQFAAWGWRIPFLLSVVLLAVSVYIRLKLEESPVFAEMKAQGKGSKAPLTESFARWDNGKLVLRALFGATAGQGVVWYAGQFYALYFLTHHAEGRLRRRPTILIAIALRRRHAVLPGQLRQALRPDRTQEDHHDGHACWPSSRTSRSSRPRRGAPTPRSQTRWSARRSSCRRPTYRGSGALAVEALVDAAKKIVLPEQAEDRDRQGPELPQRPGHTVHARRRSRAPATRSRFRSAAPR